MPTPKPIMDEGFPKSVRNPIEWWARAFAGQCRAALDELAFLAPWTCSCPSQRTEPRTTFHGHRRDPDAAPNWPTLRLEASCRQSSIGLNSDATPRRARGSVNFEASSRRQAGAPGPGLRPSNGLPGNPANSPAWSTTSCSTRRVICWRSGTTSANAGGTRVTTICWLRKRDFAVSWRLLRDNCRRRAGLPWDVCSPPPVESRFSFPGAVRCSNTSCRSW